MGNVCIYEDSDQLITLSIKELLDSKGILTFIPNEKMSNIFPVGGLGIGLYRIFFPEDQKKTCKTCKQQWM